MEILELEFNIWNKKLLMELSIDYIQHKKGSTIVKTAWQKSYKFQHTQRKKVEKIEQSFNNL